VHGIRRKRDGYQVGLREHERRLLRETSEELAALLAGGEAPPRLFPSAYRDDEEAAAEYERLVRPSLEDGKLAALRTLAATSDAARLDEETAQVWLSALNDLRLALGTRLDVREDDGITRLTEPGYAVYLWLTWLQSELIDALTRE
jgi:Domain of unknown function (DUF2017)